MLKLTISSVGFQNPLGRGLAQGNTTVVFQCDVERAASYCNWAKPLRRSSFKSDNDSANDNVNHNANNSPNANDIDNAIAEDDSNDTVMFGLASVLLRFSSGSLRFCFGSVRVRFALASVMFGFA